MKYHYLPKSSQNVAKWQGGSTTELLVLPKNTNYADRNFEVRVSSATVEESPSLFTHLPSYTRVLMPLSHPLTLSFDDGQRTETIQPFESMVFDGGVRTASYGKCIDIGVMHSINYTAKIVSAHNGTLHSIDGYCCIYALDDGVCLTLSSIAESQTTENMIADKVNFSHDNIHLQKGDFLTIESCKSDLLSLSILHEKSAIVIYLQPLNAE